LRASGGRILALLNVGIGRTLETLYRIACALDVKMSEIVTEIENRL
jgi:hypothetical protein